MAMESRGRISTEAKEGRYEGGAEQMGSTEGKASEAEVIIEGVRRGDGRRGGVAQRPLPRLRVELMTSKRRPFRECSVVVI